MQKNRDTQCRAINLSGPIAVIAITSISQCSSVSALPFLDSLDGNTDSLLHSFPHYAARLTSNVKEPCLLLNISQPFFP